MALQTCQDCYSVRDFPERPDGQKVTTECGACGSTRFLETKIGRTPAPGTGRPQFVKHEIRGKDLAIVYPDGLERLIGFRTGWGVDQVAVYRRLKGEEILCQRCHEPSCGGVGAHGAFGFLEKEQPGAECHECGARRGPAVRCDLVKVQEE